jgi:2-keto-3-deoxy-L-rhamnonate aldolase RhmA
LFDLEHGCASEAGIPDQLRAIRGTATKGIVRVAAPEPDQIARVLDWGADGIMVPRIENAAMAADRSSASPVMPQSDDAAFRVR